MGVTLWVGLFVTIFFKAEKASKKDEFILSEAEGLQSLTQMLLQIELNITFLTFNFSFFIVKMIPHNRRFVGHSDF